MVISITYRNVLNRSLCKLANEARIKYGTFVPSKQITWTLFIKHEKFTKSPKHFAYHSRIHRIAPFYCSGTKYMCSAWPIVDGTTKLWRQNLSYLNVYTHKLFTLSQFSYGFHICTHPQVICVQRMWFNQFSAANTEQKEKWPSTIHIINTWYPYQS